MCVTGYMRYMRGTLDHPSVYEMAFAAIWVMVCGSQGRRVHERVCHVLHDTEGGRGGVILTKNGV